MVCFHFQKLQQVNKFSNTGYNFLVIKVKLIHKVCQSCITLLHQVRLFEHENVAVVLVKQTVTDYTKHIYMIRLVSSKTTPYIKHE